MGWFNFLKVEGFFDPESNPDPIQDSKGFQIPYWESLSYLEKLSIQIKDGKEMNLIDGLIDVIKNVSENPKDNYKTWYWFIKILGNIPNEKVSIEILNFIPVWLSGNFDTMLQTSEICDNLLPKFLNEEPTSVDIQKADIILNHIFQVEKKGEVNNNSLDGEGESYRSRSYLYFLADKFEKKELTTKVIKYCSDSFILELGRTLKFLLLDYPKGINSIIKDADKNYEIKILIKEQNLSIIIKLENSKSEDKTANILNWEDKDKNLLKEEIVSVMKKHEINYVPNEENDDTFQRLKFALETDLSSAFGFDSIRKLDSLHSNNEKLITVFGIIFRDLLNEKAKQNAQEAILLLETFCYDKRYNLPFYKRIALFVICENWNIMKSLFWKLLNVNDDIFHFFSRHEYQKELFDLLRRNQQDFAVDEIEILKAIIKEGEQNEIIERENRKEYWQLSWYSALKDIQPFNGEYLFLSKALNLTSEHYETLGEIQIRSGSVSPILKEDLLVKTNLEIVEYIRLFRPEKAWGSPTIKGLSDVLKGAVEYDPYKFSNEIELYFDVPNIYSYSIINGFEEAWKRQIAFDVEKLLHYCLHIVTNEKFYLDDEKEEGFYDYGFDLVVGSVAHLLTEGLQHDKNAFEIGLMPVVKEIIVVIVKNLKIDNEVQIRNMDYPLHLLNSVAGKSLKSLLDYSLRRARNLAKGEDNKLEVDISDLFEITLNKGIIDGYILQGMYFEQFYFLNKGWIINQVQKYYELEQKKWLAFMGGVVFGKPPFNEELYKVFYSHYERAIQENVTFNGLRNNGLVRHLTTFYFWEFETLSPDSLIIKFIENTSAEAVSSLINFVWQQKNYENSLSEIERYNFQKNILGLWEYLVFKYENSNNENEQKNLSLLMKWIVFAPELTESYKILILKSCNDIDNRFRHQLLEKLVSLKYKGNPHIIAKSIAEIISALSFKNYIDKREQDPIKDLILFLFEYDQKSVASEFCNNLASVHQQFFLREIYETKMML